MEFVTLGRRFEPVLCVSVMNVSHVDVPERYKEELHDFDVHSVNTHEF